jgi:hypothetical protein
MSKLTTYVAIPVLGVGLGFGLFFAYQSVIQQLAPAVATKAPDSNSAGKYAECVIETIRAQEAARKADKDRFVRESRGMTLGQLAMLAQMLPPRSTADAAMAQRESFMLVKETCRLKFPCTDDEVVSEDYNMCFKRGSR